MTTSCPFCHAKTSFGPGCLDCGSCGIKTELVVANRMERMTPKQRAHFIGYHHACESLPYGWCLPPMSRGEIRSYAKGFMSAPAPNKAVALARQAKAKRDASWLGL